MEKIKFQVPDSDEVVEFFVIEQTRINGMNYILVAEEEDADCEALIMKEISEETASEASYEVVEEEAELKDLSKIFASLLEDVDITI